eukprot:208469-Chlamydomonas_euryale.AAC.1
MERVEGKRLGDNGEGGGGRTLCGTTRMTFTSPESHWRGRMGCKGRSFACQINSSALGAQLWSEASAQPDDSCLQGARETRNRFWCSMTGSLRPQQPAHQDSAWLVGIVVVEIVRADFCIPRAPHPAT